MPTKKLAEYEAKRDFKKTPEPGARVPKKAARALRFVVQEHHARRLHWDFRLEKDGVGVSWAVPKGIPPDPKKNHLAVHVEDHPLEYFKFAGEIPKGEYGGGQVLIWDEGTYDPIKWSDREVMVDLHGKRLQGRYVLFQTRGKDWMIHRMDPPQDEGRAGHVHGLRPDVAGRPLADGAAIHRAAEGVGAVEARGRVVADPSLRGRRRPGDEGRERQGRPRGRDGQEARLEIRAWKAERRLAEDQESQPPGAGHRRMARRRRQAPRLSRRSAGRLLQGRQIRLRG